jgi:hypothetical protein
VAEQDEPGEGFALVASLLILPSIAILGWQTYEWLRYGEWPPVVLRQAFFWLFGSAPPSFQWVGVQSLWSSFLDTSLTLIGFCLGAVFFIIGVIRGAAAR